MKLISKEEFLKLEAGAIFCFPYHEKWLMKGAIRAGGLHFLDMAAGTARTNLLEVFRAYESMRGGGSVKYEPLDCAIPLEKIPEEILMYEKKDLERLKEFIEEVVVNE